IFDWPPNLGMLPLVTTCRITKDQRMEWSKQISETLAVLHKIGVVWGDAKPWNVLINTRSLEPHLIDFGGGFTPGYIYPALKETIEGDNQGLSKIQGLLEDSGFDYRHLTHSHD
ncbi:hypothetical protein B0H67DRAFT_481309, partial [Lasiosphaeris hirsuta]